MTRFAAAIVRPSVSLSSFIMYYLLISCLKLPVSFSGMRISQQWCLKDKIEDYRCCFVQNTFAQWIANIYHMYYILVRADLRPTDHCCFRFYEFLHLFWLERVCFLVTNFTVYEYLWTLYIFGYCEFHCQLPVHRGSFPNCIQWDTSAMFSQLSEASFDLFLHVVILSCHQGCRGDGISIPIPIPGVFLEWGISFGKLYPSKWNGGICWGYEWACRK